MWVGLELFEISEHRPATSLILKKYACHPARQFARYLPQVHHLSRSSRELDFEVVAEVVVKLLQRLDEQVVRREPDRAAPVGVATKQPCRRFARLIIHAVLIAVQDRKSTRLNSSHRCISYAVFCLKKKMMI